MRVAIVAAMAMAVMAGTASADTFPRQAWAHADGMAHLRPNGVVLVNNSVEDRLAIQDAFARWGIGYDEARIDVVESLFTADAVYQVTRGGSQPIAQAKGRDDIIKNVRAALAQQHDQRRHAISNIVIDRMTATEATALGYGIVTVAADGLILGATVIYTAELKKEPDGVWRFSRFVIGMDDYAGKPIVNPK